MKHLREVDPVAYVRFASVYRQFKDIDELRSEIDQLSSGRAEGAPAISPSNGKNREGAQP